MIQSGNQLESAKKVDEATVTPPILNEEQSNNLESGKKVDEIVTTPKEQQNNQNVQKVNEIFVAQKEIFNKMWDELRDQVVREVREHTTNTPTGTSSISSRASCTPPTCSGGDQHSGKRAGHGNAAAGPLLDLTRPPQQQNSDRESTLQMWSALGSILQNIVQESAELEQKNLNLKVRLKSLRDEEVRLKKSLGDEVSREEEALEAAQSEGPSSSQMLELAALKIIIDPSMSAPSSSRGSEGSRSAAWRDL